MSEQSREMPSTGLTRRAMIGVGASAAAAVASGGIAMAQPGQQLKRNLESLDPSDPLVTIDFSGLKAVLQTGIAWASEKIPTYTLKMSEIDGSAKWLGFVTPEGMKKYIKIPFTARQAQLLTRPMKTGVDDVLNTVLAVYKLGKVINVYSFDSGSGAFVEAADKVHVSGNIVFQWETLRLTTRGKQRVEELAKIESSPTDVSLNISKLLAIPTDGLVTKTFEVDHVPERLIWAPVFNSCDVQHETRVTDDGAAIYSTSLDVKRLLAYSSAERAAAISATKKSTSASALSGISLSDVAAVAKAAAWILAFSKEGKFEIQPNLVSGSIGISISF